MYDADFISADALTVRAGTQDLLRSISLRVNAGEIVALVGASGSGKTLTARSFLGLIRPNPGVVSGHVTVQVGTEFIRPFEHTHPTQRAQAFDQIRGRLVGYLPQAPRRWLDPLWTVQRQLEEVIRLSGSQRHTVPEWLQLAGFSHPETVMGLYPHELSGGMAQRACIALALARGSRFLLADEPTTGLDPTVRMGIIREIEALKQRGIGVLFITHDLRLVHRLADETVVLHEGQVVDRLPTMSLERASHPATRRLIEAVARISGGTIGL